MAKVAPLDQYLQDQVFEELQNRHISLRLSDIVYVYDPLFYEVEDLVNKRIPELLDEYLEQDKDRLPTWIEDRDDE